jgi:hypothetical protein
MVKEHELLLNIKPSVDDDIEDLQRLTRQLRQNINKLDVEKVDFVKAGEAPKGAKAGDIVAWVRCLCHWQHQQQLVLVECFQL